MMGCIRQWFTERELKKDTVFILIGTGGASIFKTFLFNCLDN